MHPYGCEAETSLQELFDFFTRCLQNGEWELAGACVPQLCDAGGEVSQRLRDIIKAIITYPYLLDPHKLAWLWLQVLEKWTKEEVSVSVRRELEFLLLLEELGDEVPETTLKVYTSYTRTTFIEILKLTSTITAIDTRLALANDSVLREFANGLSSQLGVLEWCVESNPGIPKEALLGQLHTLDSHSALYVLHSLTPLAQNEEHMVLDLLNTQPRPTGAGQCCTHPSPMVQRNLVLYRGFCAMKYALYAMCITSHKYSGCSDCDSGPNLQPCNPWSKPGVLPCSFPGGCRP
uniref:Uncharacterized protein n=1 Tax=Hucho hucho TaxID=62062 RepID=A0A4W5RLT5_9TELE